MEKLLLLFCLLGMWTMVNGDRPLPLQASGPPSVDCNAVILDIYACVDYLQKGSALPKPSVSCCDALITVSKVSPTCVCEALETSQRLGLALDVTKTAGLPSACGVSTPIACPGIVGPSPAPPKTPTPSPPPKQSPEVPAPPKSEGHAPAPSPVHSHSGATSTSILSLVLTVSLVIVTSSYVMSV